MNFIILAALSLMSPQEYQNYCVSTEAVYQDCYKYEKAVHYVEKGCLSSNRDYCKQIEASLSK